MLVIVCTTKKNLEHLQIILFFKEAGIKLKQIHQIMLLPPEELDKALKAQQENLYQEKVRLENIISAIEQYVTDRTIFKSDLFVKTSVTPLKKQYDAEAKIVYGNTREYKVFEKKIRYMNDEERTCFFQEFEGKMKAILRAFSKHMMRNSSFEQVKPTIHEWKNCLIEYTPCTDDFLLCISSTYATDNRFKQYINQFTDSDGDLSLYIYQMVQKYISEKRDIE
jgi:DNA-binding transcriptional MerR regulator